MCRAAVSHRQTGAIGALGYPSALFKWFDCAQTDDGEVSNLAVHIGISRHTVCSPDPARVPARTPRGPQSRSYELKPPPAGGSTAFYDDKPYAWDLLQPLAISQRPDGMRERVLIN